MIPYATYDSRLREVRREENLVEYSIIGSGIVRFEPNEPDAGIYKHPSINRYYLIRRIPTMGHLCGYVFLRSEREAIDIPTDMLNVHGGVTFNDVLSYVKYLGNTVEEQVKCRLLPEMGNNVHAIGFDCAHLGDLTIGSCGRTDVYRNWQFVHVECIDLAEQIENADVLKQYKP